MKRETTPTRVTDKIMELCNKAVPGGTPEYVPVKVQQWSRPQECFPNVQQMVLEHGGKQINGWAVWQWANILAEVEAHAVWESPEGNLIDITPHDNGEKEILFLADQRVEYNNNTIPSIRMALTASPLIAELIQLMNERDKIMCETPGHECSIPKELLLRIMNIQLELHQEVGKNEFCPCQSGLKYKKCCGKE